MPVPSWVVPVVTLLGAFIVSVSNYAVQRWRYRADRLNVSIDLLCTEINAAARSAAEYWFHDAENLPKCQQIELELVGLQERLQQLIAAVQAQDENLDLDDCGEAVMDLFDSMTGGAFRVSGRKQDVVRAGRVYSAAATLNGSLRIAVARRSKLFSITRSRFSRLTRRR